MPAAQSYRSLRVIHDTSFVAKVFDAIRYALRTRNLYEICSKCEDCLSAQDSMALILLLLFPLPGRMGDLF